MCVSGLDHCISKDYQATYVSSLSRAESESMRISYARTVNIGLVVCVCQCRQLID